MQTAQLHLHANSYKPTNPTQYCMLTEKWSKVPFERLQLNRRDIYLNMGAGRYIPDPEMQQCVEETIGKIAALCHPEFGYRVFKKESESDTTITIAGTTLSCGNVITPIVSEAEYECLFIATTGSEFQQWLEQEASSGDILREFVASNIGSEIAEAVARVAAAELAAECALHGLNVGNSYSPGYCGWPLTDQQSLFALMPSRPCGVHLTPSCLMMPIKSVSGIIPVGAGIVKKKYSCAICDRKDCYKKAHKKNTTTKSL